MGIAALIIILILILAYGYRMYDEIKAERKRRDK